MEELTKSLKAYLYDRTSSPLLGAFVISWGLWNYKFIAVLLSGLKVDDKFEYISSILYTDYYLYIFQGFIFPLLTAVLFIYLYPIPAAIVYEYTRNKQKHLREIRQKIEDEELLTVEESRQIRKHMEELKIEYENRIVHKNNEINNLTGLLKEEKKHRVTIIDSKDNSTDATFPKIDIIKVLRDIQINKEMSLLQICNSSDMTIAHTRDMLQDLVNKRLVSIRTKEGDEYYSLTKEGLIYLTANLS